MSGVDSVLNQTSRTAKSELEVERILKAFKLNPYDVMDIPHTSTDSEIKSSYRKKSVLIHPDKCKHEKAEEAFDLLKKAESSLSTPGSRSEIDAIMKHSRTEVLKKLLGSGFSTSIADSDPRLQNLNPPLEIQIRNKAKEVLVEDELARRKKVSVQFANEGAEKARQEEEVAARKRKAEDHVKWEERREDRIHHWRDFNGKKQKKSSKNTHVLG